MRDMTVEEPHTFLAQLGDLHDADLLALAWNPPNSTLALHIDDLYASFASPGLTTTTARGPWSCCSAA